MGSCQLTYHMHIRDGDLYLPERALSYYLLRLEIHRLWITEPPAESVQVVLFCPSKE